MTALFVWLGIGHEAKDQLTKCVCRINDVGARLFDLLLDNVQHLDQVHSNSLLIHT